MKGKVRGKGGRERDRDEDESKRNKEIKGVNEDACEGSCLFFLGTNGRKCKRNESRKKGESEYYITVNNLLY